MMGAFILAGLVALGTLALVALILMADMMSDAPDVQISPGPTLLIGLTLAALILGSHWLSQVGW